MFLHRRRYLEIAIYYEKIHVYLVEECKHFHEINVIYVCHKIFESQCFLPIVITKNFSLS